MHCRLLPHHGLLLLLLLLLVVVMALLLLLLLLLMLLMLLLPPPPLPPPSSLQLPLQHLSERSSRTAPSTAALPASSPAGAGLPQAPLRRLLL